LRGSGGKHIKGKGGFLRGQENPSKRGAELRKVASSGKRSHLGRGAGI